MHVFINYVFYYVYITICNLPAEFHFLHCLIVKSHSGIPVGVTCLFASLGFLKLRTKSGIRSCSAVIPGKIC